MVANETLRKIALDVFSNGVKTMDMTLVTAHIVSWMEHEDSEDVDLKTVSNALGHSTISTTADIYAHVTDSLMRDAADRIDATIANTARTGTK